MNSQPSFEPGPPATEQMMPPAEMAPTLASPAESAFAEAGETQKTIESLADIQAEMTQEGLSLEGMGTLKVEYGALNEELGSLSTERAGLQARLAQLETAPDTEVEIPTAVGMETPPVAETLKSAESEPLPPRPVNIEVVQQAPAETAPDVSPMAESLPSPAAEAASTEKIPATHPEGPTLRSAGVEAPPTVPEAAPPTMEETAPPTEQADTVPTARTETGNETVDLTALMHETPKSDLSLEPVKLNDLAQEAPPETLADAEVISIHEPEGGFTPQEAQPLMRDQETVDIANLMKEAPKVEPPPTGEEIDVDLSEPEEPAAPSVERPSQTGTLAVSPEQAQALAAASTAERMPLPPTLLDTVPMAPEGPTGTIAQAPAMEAMRPYAPQAERAPGAARVMPAETGGPDVDAIYDLAKERAQMGRYIGERVPAPAETAAEAATVRRAEAAEPKTAAEQVLEEKGGGEELPEELADLFAETAVEEKGKREKETTLEIGPDELKALLKGIENAVGNRGKALQQFFEKFQNSPEYQKYLDNISDSGIKALKSYSEELKNISKKLMEEGAENPKKWEEGVRMNQMSLNFNRKVLRKLELKKHVGAASEMTILQDRTGKPKAVEGPAPKKEEKPEKPPEAVEEAPTVVSENAPTAKELPRFELPGENEPAAPEDVIEEVPTVAEADAEAPTVVSENAPTAKELPRFDLPGEESPETPTLVDEGTPTVVAEEAPTVVSDAAPTVRMEGPPTIAEDTAPTLADEGPPTIQEAA